MSEHGHLVLRCSDCGNCFGSKTSTTNPACSACGSVAKHVLLERAENAGDLQKRVALSNVPPELRTQLSEKMARLPQWEDTDDENINPKLLRNLLEKSIGEDDLVTIETLKQTLKKAGIDSPTAEELLEFCEGEGVVLRIDDGKWRWIS